MTGSAADERPAVLENRLRGVFAYLKEYSARSEPTVRAQTDYTWRLRMAEIPEHPAVTRRIYVDLAVEAPEAQSAQVLSVRRPTLTHPPILPPQLVEWVEGPVDDPEQNPKFLESAKRPPRGDKEENWDEPFEADAIRVKARIAYESTWTAWASTEGPARQVLSVFESLFALHGKLIREYESVELMLADGILRGWTEQGPITHPILLQRVELEFDAEGPSFLIRLADKGPELATALVREFSNLSPAMLNQLEGEVDGVAVHPLGGDITASFLRRLVQQLHPHGSYTQEAAGRNPVAGAPPCISRDLQLLLRKRTVGFSNAFAKIVEDIEDGAPIPLGLERLVGVERARSAVAAFDYGTPWSEPKDVLLCKPANHEQVQIARTLDAHGAVLVQGPPGTGKSHTIANLIGHLLAQGKRILVTSHTTKALRVLRGHLPENLQPLCVSLLDTDVEGRKELERSVGRILERLANTTPAELRRQSSANADEREKLLSALDHANRDLRTSRESETTPIVIGGESLSPSDAARWCREATAAHGWIPGFVAPGSALTLTDEEVRALYESNESLSPEDAAQLEIPLPEPSEILTPQEFAVAVAPEVVVSVADAQLWAPQSRSDALEHLREDLAAVEMLDVSITTLQSWERRIVKDGMEGGAQRKAWVALADAIDAVAALSSHAEGQSNAELVSDMVPSDSLEQALEVMNQIGQKFSPRQELGGLALWFNGDWKRTLAWFKVQGRAPSTGTDIVAIRAHLRDRIARMQVERRWQVLASTDTGLPPLADLPKPYDAVLERYATAIRRLLGWWAPQWESIESRVRRSGLRLDELENRSHAELPFAMSFEIKLDLIKTQIPSKVRARIAALDWRAQQQRLARMEEALSSSSSPAAARLLNACRRRDSDAYSAEYKEMHRLAGRRAIIAMREDFLARLALCAPDWSIAVRDRRGVHAASQPPGDAAFAWRYVQIRAELDRRTALDEKSLRAQIESLQNRLHNVTIDLVDTKAWLAQHERTTLAQRQALQVWADLQVRIGRGTGPRAPRYRAQASEALLQAHAAVPIWVMPLARVVESFAPDGPRFDVVIIDEASQMDIRGLLAWYLGSEIVVVGDHEQVSPSAVGEEAAVVQQLAAQYLGDFRYAPLFDGKTSVYHLARSCFGGTIMLREHFRCVPDIIAFSNHLAYEGQILPLRDARTAPAPHLVEHSAAGVLGSTKSHLRNLSEARLIACLIEALLDQAGEGAPPSIGAIALVGDEQADLITQVALDVVGAARLHSCGFLAGNPAQFQGDERDIVLLSMVDQPTGSRLRLRNDATFKQRYNVAVSRARNQLWLVHSLAPESDLQADDLRARLIQHVRNPRSITDALARVHREAGSPFEVEVASALVRQGFHIEQQVQVGNYFIDMVASSGAARIAIECDGEQWHGPDRLQDDLFRQAMLERAGWRFIRIRGSRYFRNPDETIQELVQDLKTRGIEPVAATEVAPGRNGFIESILARASQSLLTRGWTLPPTPQALT